MWLLCKHITLPPSRVGREQEDVTSNSSKAATHSSVHSKFFHLWRSWKNGWHRSTYREINLFKTAVIPISFCTSLGFRGGCKSLIALIWSGLTSIPRCVVMYPKNFLKLTLKEHLDALRQNLCFLSTENTSYRSFKGSETCLLFTTISSMYALIILPICDSNIQVTFSDT